MTTSKPRSCRSRAVARPTAPQPITAAFRTWVSSASFGRAPGEGHATPPVAVVVDERPCAELLDPDDEPGCTKRAQPSDLPRNPVICRIDAGKSFGPGLGTCRQPAAYGQCSAAEPSDECASSHGHPPRPQRN